MRAKRRLAFLNRYFATKGMQPQSSINSTSKFDAKFNQQQQYIQEQLQQQLPTSSVTTNATAAVYTSKRSPSVKVIKCKKPLCHFKFYLDICDHQLTKRIEEQIKLLGGSLEFFLTSNVTHFITDKPTVLPGNIRQKVAQGNYNHSPGTPQTPTTPLTPQTPYSLESQEVKSSNGFKTNGNNTNSVNAKKTLRQSRADAILSRARRQSVTSATNTPPFSALGNQLGTNSVQTAATTPLKSQQAFTASPAYILWQAEHALRFFKKVQHELKEYLGHIKRSSIKSGSIEPISLKGGFIKIETIRRNCRPYYQLFRKSNEWPKVEISREDGAFRLSPKREIPKGEEYKKIAVLDANMTRKSRSRSSQHQSTVKILKKSTANSQRNAVACKQQQQQQPKESSDKQCGVCEICKIEYDTLTIHLKTKDHEYFAKNPQNFIALDTLIHTSADVNNFLEENRKLEIKSEPREMDVDDVEDDEEIGNNNEEETIVPTVTINNSNQKNISEDSVTLVVPKSLSPTLREKSKRVTKGKHSSEKFQNLPSKSLKVPSPQKNVCIGRSFVNEIQSSVFASGLNKNCKKLSSSALSPPIRATLPPSSLYKVVETHTDLNCTPPKGRGGRDGAVAAASPSIIVKFKKVRATELQVLNGEAESFMFPKRRSDSSDLPTDIDRQTTSDRVGNTSSSTHSSFSEAEDTTDNLMRIDDVKSTWGKRAVATAKRKSLKGAIVNSSKKINDINKQSFPKAPIQPVQQLKQPTATRKKSTNNDVATAAAIVAATATITLPEATRKSSRTATAIVTAATTSSRLLQAAVEAAKSKNRHLSTEAATATYSKTKTPKKRIKVEAVIEDKDGTEAAVEKESSAQSASKLTLRQKRSRRKPVVKLEDGMGEQNRSKQIPIEDDDEDEIDFDDFDDATVDSDDIRDEDFVIEAERKAQARLKRLNSVKKMLSTNTREERATKRQNRLLNFMKQERQESQTELNDSMQKPAKLKVKKPAKATKPPSKKSQRKSSANKKRSKKIERVFDFTKSERLKKLRYAFERLPTSDLWYRVYMRQDECQERYFEYYGTTTYRKLPYELGPIPFETTFLDGSNGAKICCNLCQSSQTDSEKDAFNGNTAKSELYNLEIKGEKYETKPPSTSDSGASSSNVVNDFANISGTTLGNYTTPQAYTHKHKKLHLLQRYRQEQEQQELLQRQKLEENMKLGVDIKDDTSRIEGCVAVTPIESMREQRAGSTHSNASSCASSAATLNKAKKVRQRHFNKASYLAHLELPPRKSPREHASTLALVSCIIKQRQDSLSKPNSETDEPPTTPLALTPIDIKPLLDIKSPLLPIETPAAAALPASLEVDAHSDSLRLQAPTPEEELRFATEISETVKRMRRGRNKYDYSPPFVARKVRRPRSNRGRGAANCVLATTSSLWDKPLQVNRLIPQIPQTSCIKSQIIAPTVVKRRRGRQKACFVEVNSLMPSIRKTGSKKGVLEFEADATALKTLKSAPTDYVNPKLLEWQIDKYLSSVGRQYDEPEQNILLANRCDLRIPNQSTINQNTPPSTDHFSSDFDLCDLLNQGAARESLGTEALGTEENRLVVDTKQKDFSFFNSIALHSYYRKRKTLKCNRTGWPKVSKKKSTCRQQKLRQRIYFMKDSEPKIESNLDKLNKEGIKQEPMDVEDIDGGDNMEDNDDTTQERTRESAAITPPNSEIELNAFAVNANAVLSERKKQNEEQEDDETQMMLIEEQEDADTMLESVEEEEETNKMESDVDADIEEVDDDDDGEEEEEDVESRKPVKSLQFKHQTTAYALADESTEKPMPSLELLSPVEKFRNRLLNNSVNSVHSLAASSTPTIHLMRPLRRTPQLNGSLGSCISPSEKAGDNSDIFTVSSDGLETDLDLSNSHSQLKCINDDDSRHQNHHHYHESHLNNAVGNITPKRKFDISKYAPTNAATCAAEAATAAVKSLAISQFLKKEVRVTCRRLRAPFRRFRYRR
ncbi:DBF4-CDC7 kinase regulatory subunit chiffon isoform 1-T1 [Glossina fuscipes fuscipes]